MTTDFLGTYENKVHNNRLVIPAPFKAQMTDIKNPKAPINVVYTIGYQNNCIVLYPVEAWQNKKEQLKNGDAKAKRLLEMMVVHANPEQLEGPGRVKITDKLLRKIGIKDKGDVVIIGQGSYISIWSPEKYEAMSDLYLQNNDFDAEDYQI